MSRILQETQRDEVERCCREGHAHAAAGEHAEALACFLEAWEVLPEPREEYQATSQVLRGLTGVLRARGELGGGLQLLLSARSRFAPVPSAMGWRARGE